MQILSNDNIFSEMIENYLADSKIPESALGMCIIIDLDSYENTDKNAVTFSRYEEKSPDLLRPFLMTDLLEKVKEHFGGNEESTALKATENTGNSAETGKNTQIDESNGKNEITLTSDGVYYKNVFTPLTSREHDLLALLLENRGFPLSREEIYRLLWGEENAESNVVDVYIRYLRKKLDFSFGERIIYTRRGCGYYVK